MASTEAMDELNCEDPSPPRQPQENLGTRLRAILLSTMLVAGQLNLIKNRLDAYFSYIDWSCLSSSPRYFTVVCASRLTPRESKLPAIVIQIFYKSFYISL